MSKAIDELLESVAREIAQGVNRGIYDVANSLRERLGPVLEAGQAMRDSDTLAEHMNHGEIWDAALAAGKGQA